MLAWSGYDLANTVFLVSIHALHFPLWITEDLGGSDTHLAIAISVATALATISSPLVGAVSDRAGRRMPFLIATTILSVLFTAFLGFPSLPITLTLFVLASFFFQTGVVFYDSLLPAVSSAKTHGRVGGLGVSFGFAGTPLAIAAGVVAEKMTSGGPSRPLTFILVAMLFLIAALPCFIFVREPARVTGTPRPLADAFRQLRDTARRAKQFPGLLRFLSARFFYTDALNTLLLFIAIYLVDELGMSQRQTDTLLALFFIMPIVSALIGGRFVDRHGPRQVLQVSLVFFVAALSLTASLPYIGDSYGGLVWIAAALTGIAIGGMFASDRPLLIRLTPPEYIGEFFGLHNMAGRFSAIVGPLLWVYVAESLDLGRPLAVGSLAVMALIGMLIIRTIRVPASTS